MKKKILIIVKTYPTASSSYDELVCTAGIDENGNWIRLFPIPFRKLTEDNQYKKYQWINIDVEKNSSDPRPESYRPKSHEIEILESVDTDKGTWQRRKDLLLKNVWDDFDKLIAEAKDENKRTSLGIFKPAKILKLKITKAKSLNWNEKTLKKIEERHKQIDIFSEKEDDFRLVRKLPYKFSYEFKDINGKKRCLMIEDWEIGALYWNLKRKYPKDENKVLEGVRNKYFNEFTSKDIYLFVGTSQKWQFGNSPNPFMIIGVFFPPKIERPSLF